MYIPKKFLVEDEEKILKYIEYRELGNLITFSGEIFNNSYIPFYYEKIDGKIFLYSHLSKKNNHLDTIKNGKTIISFLGPDNYISHKFYFSKINVPTWNYASLNIYGKCEILNELETTKVAIKILEKHESKVHGIDNILINKLSKFIVGIRFEVNKFECKFKFSQNKNNKDIKEMEKEIKKRGNNSDKEVLNFLNKIFNY